MTRLHPALFAALLALCACGEDPVSPQPQDASTPCNPEPNQAFCDRVGNGACGQIKGEDDCGEPRTVDCPCPAVCGNGEVEGKETCDGNCPASCDDGEACTMDTPTGSRERCDFTCLHTSIARCTGADGCCPEGCTPENDLDCRPSCGDGTVDSGETCDGNCPASCDDGLSCTADTRSGSASTCDVRCINTSITACAGGDGCCPIGCTSVNDPDCRPSCGNGLVEAGESCDGNCPATCDDLQACTTDRQNGTAANCDMRCSHTAVTACTGGDGCCPSGCDSGNDSDCRPSCGNGVVDSGESCDGNCPATCADTQACTVDAATGSASTCDLRCTHTPITACTAGDGCCPSGCAFPADSDCPKTCTDECATLDAVQCDGTAVETCLTGADGCRHWTETEQCTACAQGACLDCAGACVRRVDGSAAAGGDGLGWQTAFRTLQPAIDAAAAHAEACAGSCQVWVADGTYFVHGSHGDADPADDTVELRTGVEVYGGFDGAETALAERDLKANRAILDGRDGPAGTQAVAHVVTGADGAVLDGFTVTQGHATWAVSSSGGGLLASSGQTTVRNTLFSDNVADNRGGAVAATYGNAQFFNCTFLRNRAPGGGAAYASRGKLSFVNCTFSLNEATDAYQVRGGALEAGDSASIAVTNSILWKNAPIEHSAANYSSVSFSHSAVFRGATGTGNLREDPKLRVTPEGLLALRSDSPCIDAGRGDAADFTAPATDAFGQARFDAPAAANSGTGTPSYVDMGAIEYRGEATGPVPQLCVRYVDAASTAAAPDGLGWASAFKTIQEGIDSAWNLIKADPAAVGCEVWVKGGTYRIFSTGTETVRLRPQVALLGGFAGTESAASQRDWAANLTTIDGCYAVCTVDWRVKHVVTGDDHATIDGFTITNGNASAETGWEGVGGGMTSNGYCPTIRNCTFADNNAGVSGGGLYLRCGFEQRLSNLSFLRNYAQNGSALYVSAGPLTIEDGLFQDNYFSNWDGNGGAIYLAGRARIVNTIFDGNRTANGDGGAIYGYYSQLSLEQCTFTDNHVGPVGDGGAVYNLNGTVTGTGCTFTNNVALNGHGGAICDSEGANHSTCTGCTYSTNHPDDLYSY